MLYSLNKWTIWATLTIASVLTISAVYATVQPYDEPYQLIDQAGAGSVRLHIDSAGNVGIGTTSPTHPFTLRHVDDNSPALTIISASDVNRRLYQQYDGANNVAIIRGAEEGVGSTNIALNPFGGNVGVGTLGPTHPLTLRHVDDNSPAFTIISASDPNRRLYQQYDGANNVAIIRGAEEGVGATNVALNPFGGNVGIGTTTPSALLNVAGNLDVDGDIDVSGTSGGDDDAICFDDGTQCITWIETSGEFLFNSLADFNGGGIMNVEGGLIVNEGTFTATGDAIIDGNLDLTGFSGGDDDEIFFDDGTSTTLRWNEGNTRFEFSDELAVDGPIQTGTTLGPAVLYNRMGTTTTGADGHTLNSADDLLVFDDLAVNGNADFTNSVDISDNNFRPLRIDRIGTDGNLIEFFNDGVFGGAISVAGTTITYGPFTGSHYAWTTQEPQRGMVVSMNGQNKHFLDNPEAEILYGVDISTLKNDPAILGTYLGLMESALPQTTENPQLIMSAGNGQVWIADFGQDIEPGDLLISSDVPGHAMIDDRTAELSYIIGRAGESVVWSEVSDTIDGVKHKKISILFNFVPLNNN